jgi:hypothetical protein
MLISQILGIGVGIALIAIALIRNRTSTNVTAARERAALRAKKAYRDVSFDSGGITVQHIDPEGRDLTPSQFAICKLIEAGFSPEIKKETYKYKGAPRNRVAGVPDNYGDWNE